VPKFEPDAVIGQKRVYGSYTLTLPGNKEYSVPQVKMLLKENERGIKREIPLDKWENL